MERAGTLPEADAPHVQAALALLANDQLRHFRLEVSVDSIQEENWNQSKGERNELAHSVTALLSQILPAAQQTPSILPAGIGLLRFMVSGYKGAKDFEGTLEAMAQQLLADTTQAAQAPERWNTRLHSQKPAIFVWAHCMPTMLTRPRIALLISFQKNDVTSY